MIRLDLTSCRLFKLIPLHLPQDGTGSCLRFLSRTTATYTIGTLSGPVLFEQRPLFVPRVVTLLTLFCPNRDWMSLLGARIVLPSYREPTGKECFHVDHDANAHAASTPSKPCTRRVRMQAICPTESGQIFAYARFAVARVPPPPVRPYHMSEVGGCAEHLCY